MGNFFEAIEKQNRIVQYYKPTKDERQYFLCRMNSYLGIIVVRVKKYIVPDGTSYEFHLHLYQYIVPTGTVPLGT